MAVVHRRGQGEHIGGASAVTIKARGEDTAGSLYLGEAVAQPGFAGPPPHRHRHVHDMFYVLEGVLTVRLADHTSTSKQGPSSASSPARCTPFSNTSEEPVRFLNFNTRPAGRTTCATSERLLASGGRTAYRRARVVGELLEAKPAGCWGGDPGRQPDHAEDAGERDHGTPQGSAI